MQSTSRLLWADVIRVLAIFLVIVVHSSIVPSSPFPLTNTFFFLLSFSIAKVCVPLFIMLSGALLLDKKESYPIFFKKRVMKVVIPWIAWTILYMIWNYLFHEVRPSNISAWKYFFEVTLLSTLWFLPLITAIYLMTPIIRIGNSLLQKKDKIYIILTWFIWVSVLPFLHASPAFPLSSQGGLFSVACAYIGYFFLGNFLIKLSSFKKSLLIPFAIIASGVLMTFLEIFLMKTTYLASYQTVVFDYFAPGIVITSAGLFLFLYNVFSHMTLRKTMWGNSIVLLSRASLGIYIVHELVKEQLDPFITHTLLANFVSLPLLETYISASIVFIVSFLLVRLLQSIPLVKIVVP